jgi:hypothetical protein
VTVHEVPRGTERTWIRATDDAWSSAGAIAQRRDAPGYAHGVAAGHADALAHIEPLIRGLWSDLRTFRVLRNTSHRELADFRVYTRLADANTVVLRDLFAIRRALKGGAR